MAPKLYTYIFDPSPPRSFPGFSLTMDRAAAEDRQRRRGGEMFIQFVRSPQSSGGFLSHYGFTGARRQ